MLLTVESIQTEWMKEVRSWIGVNLLPNKKKIIHDLRTQTIFDIKDFEIDLCLHFFIDDVSFSYNVRSYWSLF